MGRNEASKHSELTSVPKVSEKSRQLSLMKIYGLETKTEDVAATDDSECLTSRSDGYPSVRSNKGPPDIDRLMRTSKSKPTVPQKEESVPPLAPLKNAPPAGLPPAKKLTLNRHVVYKTKELEMEKDETKSFNNYSMRFAEEKGAKIQKEIAGRAVVLEDKQKMWKKTGAPLDMMDNNRTKILNVVHTENQDGKPLRTIRSDTHLSPIINSQRKPQVSNGIVKRFPEDGAKDGEITTQLERSQTIPPPQRLNNNPIVPGFSLDQIRNAQETAEKAIKHGKIFAHRGHWIVQRALKERGWVEKSCYHWKPEMGRGQRRKKTSGSGRARNQHINNDLRGGFTKDYSNIDGFMSQLVRNFSPNFIWSEQRAAIDFNFLHKHQIFNHFCHGGSFTTKDGLCVNLRNVVWFDNANRHTFFPRCYDVSVAEEKNAFIDDFRLTACQSILRHVIETYGRQSSAGSAEKDDVQRDSTKQSSKGSGKKRRGKSAGPRPLSSPMRKKKDATVNERIVDLAIQQCERWLGLKHHLDIDRWDDPHLLSTSAWKELIESYYKIVSGRATITNASAKVEDCENTVVRLREHCLQFEMDGIRNVWIIKPSAQHQGKGISVSDNLEDIQKRYGRTMMVVQKYIERPLLVHNTKFDIRQWFLVTDVNPLTVWFYKDCYLRFCSQQYTLDNFNKAIHLSNVAIQRHCANGPRSASLPLENMWDSEDFKRYLSGRGQGQAWADKIYPGMKKAVICSLLSGQDSVEDRKGSFELYGADFMLTNDLNPWLIEINSGPDLSSSTPITKRMCHSVIEDVIKVVIDRRDKPNCDTGGFELAYKQKEMTVLPYLGTHLEVKGQSIPKSNRAVKNTEELSPPYLHVHKQFLASH